MPGLYTGRCIDDRILFRSTFDTPSVVAGQGITLVGGPTVDRGLSLNGTTQYAKKDQVVIPSGGALWCKIVFTPDFAYNENALRFILGSTAGITVQPEIFVYRHNVANGSTLFVIIGTSDLTAPGANYGPYWLQGQRNTLVFSQGPAAGNRGVWLNGNSVVLSSSTNDARAVSVTPLYFGYAASYPTYLFDGTVHEIVVGTGSLTAGEAADLYQNDETEELRPEQAVVWLPMRRVYGAGTAPSPRRTPNLGSLDAACDAYLGADGQGATTDEPALISPHGFYFDGSGRFLTVPHNANLSFGNGAGTDYPWSVAFMFGVSSNAYVLGRTGVAVGSGDLQFYTASGHLVTLVNSYTEDGSYIYAYASSVFEQTAEHKPTCVVVTYDASKAWTGIKHYFDGALKTTVGAASGTYLGTGNIAGRNLCVGFSNTPSGYMTGKLHEAAIFPFELTPRQVAMLSAQMKARANV